MPILPHVGGMQYTGIKKFKKHQNMIFGHIECIGCVRGKNSLRDSRGELLSINADIATRGCVVFNRNEKVQKAPKHDFWTYWSVGGAFVAKNHFVIRAGELLSITANIGIGRCDVFHRNESVQKAPKHDFWTYWSVLGAFVAKNHFVIRAANFCQLMPILAHVGAMFFTGMKKFQKHQNMIFGHIGEYWVRSWQKITS